MSISITTLGATVVVVVVAVVVVVVVIVVVVVVVGLVVVVLLVVVAGRPIFSLGRGLRMNPGNLLDLGSVEDCVVASFASSSLLFVLGRGRKRFLGALNNDDLDGLSVVVVAIKASGDKVFT